MGLRRPRARPRAAAAAVPERPAARGRADAAGRPPTADRRRTPTRWPRCSRPSPPSTTSTRARSSPPPTSSASATSTTARATASRSCPPPPAPSAPASARTSTARRSRCRACWAGRSGSARCSRTSTSWPPASSRRSATARSRCAPSGDRSPPERGLEASVTDAAQMLREYMNAFLDDYPDAILQLTGGQDSRLLLSAVPRSQAARAPHADARAPRQPGCRDRRGAVGALRARARGAAARRHGDAVAGGGGPPVRGGRPAAGVHGRPARARRADLRGGPGGAGRPRLRPRRRGRPRLLLPRPRTLGAGHPPAGRPAHQVADVRQRVRVRRRARPGVRRVGACVRRSTRCSRSSPVPDATGCRPPTTSTSSSACSGGRARPRPRSASTAW